MNLTHSPNSKNQARIGTVLFLCVSLYSCSLFKSHPEDNLKDAVEQGIVEVHDRPTKPIKFDLLEENKGSYSSEYEIGDGTEIDGAVVIDLDNGQVIGSDDGQSWKVLRSSSGDAIHKLLVASDDSPLLAVSGNQMLIKAENDWQTLKSFGGDILKVIRQGESTWVFTNIDYTPFAHYSVDLGQTWASIEIPDTDYFLEVEYHCLLKSCAFLDDNEVGFLLVDDKGELTATKQEIKVANHNTHIHDCCNSTIFWSEELKQVWIGYYDTGSVYTSNDKGKSWSLASNTGAEDIVTTWFVDKERSLMFEMRNEGLRSYAAVTEFENGAWKDISALPIRFKDKLNYACWLNKNQGLVKMAIYDTMEEDEPKYFVTNDAGQTWYTLDLSINTGGYNCIRWHDRLEIDNKAITFKS